MTDLYAVAGEYMRWSPLFTTTQFRTDFCLIPMGTGEPSVAEYIAECQRILENSGLTYKVRLLTNQRRVHSNIQDSADAVSISAANIYRSDYCAHPPSGYGTNLGKLALVMPLFYPAHALQ